MKPNAGQGFSLTEAVVALAILLLAVVGCYILIGKAAALNKSARDHYVAILLANNRLELAKTRLYSDLSTLAETRLRVDEYGGPDPEGRFRRTTLVNTNYNTNLTEVIALVEILNRRTKTFSGEAESNACLYTEYLTEE